MKEEIAKYALIGGSSTFSIKFPEEIEGFETTIIDEYQPDTPFGKAPKLKLFEIENRDGTVRRILTVKMHGWMHDVPRFEASRRLFRYFSQAGVERVVAEGGVGSIDPQLKLRDFVIPEDFIDFSKSTVSVGGGKLLIMRDPFCPDIRDILAKSARAGYERVLDGGVYFSTEGQRFESAAEVAMARTLGADYVGQSAVPEVYLARVVGACYAGAHLVVNYAEGVNEPWSYDDLKKIFYEDSKLMGKVLLQTLVSLPEGRSCKCKDYAKESLLTEDESEPLSRS